MISSIPKKSTEVLPDQGCAEKIHLKKISIQDTVPGISSKYSILIEPSPLVQFFKNTLPALQDDPVQVLTTKLFDNQDIKILVLTYLPTSSWTKPSKFGFLPSMSSSEKLSAYDLYRGIIFGDDIRRWDKELPQILDGLKTISECEISSPHIKGDILHRIKTLSNFLKNRNHDTYRKDVLMERAMRPSVEYIQQFHFAILNAILSSSDKEILNSDSLTSLNTVDEVIFQQSDSIFSKALKDFYRELIDLRKSVVPGATDLQEDQLEKFKEAAKGLIDEKKSAVAPFFIPRVLSALILIKWAGNNEKKIEELFFDLMNYSIATNSEYACQIFTEMESLGRQAISDNRPLLAKRLTGLMDLLLLKNPHMVHPIKDKVKERVSSLRGANYYSALPDKWMMIGMILLFSERQISQSIRHSTFKVDPTTDEKMQLFKSLLNLQIAFTCLEFFSLVGYLTSLHKANLLKQRYDDSWKDAVMGENHLYTSLKGLVGKMARQSRRKVLSNAFLSPLPKKILEGSDSSSDQKVFTHLLPKCEPLKIKRF